MRAILRLKRFWRWLGALAVCGILAFLLINAWVLYRGRALTADLDQVRPAQTALVLGALVFPDGSVSDMVADRLETALSLYQAGKVQKILVSGDHGRTTYDEVNTMRLYLEKRGVPTENIFMDHAGFDTYNSMYRARDVFAVRDLIVITQRFHLPRALYLARGLGLDAQGVVADRHTYWDERYYDLRETAARIKAFGEILVKPKPVFLGPVIAITGDGRVTHDRPK